MRQFLIYLFPIFFSCITSSHVIGQPYIDLFQVNLTHSPNKGLWRQTGQQNSFHHIQGDFTLPIIFKKDSSMLLLCPFTEHWWLDIPNSILPKHYSSYGMQITLIKPISEHWGLNAVLIPRFNGVAHDALKNSFQAGGAVLFAFHKSNTLSFKFGIYYNSEFSGPYIMPLAGVDWQVNPKTTIFGILPGSLNIERTYSKHLRYGLAFRAITNSYQDGFINSSQQKGFLRVDENQLGLYSDIYITKNWVLNLELGHSVFRRFRAGYQKDKPRFPNNDPMKDAIYFRGGIAYRLHLR